MACLYCLALYCGITMASIRFPIMKKAAGSGYLKDWILGWPGNPCMYAMNRQTTKSNKVESFVLSCSFKRSWQIKIKKIDEEHLSTPKENRLQPKALCLKHTSRKLYVSI